jgi:hypothetical protein
MLSVLGKNAFLNRFHTKQFSQFFYKLLENIMKKISTVLFAASIAVASTAASAWGWGPFGNNGYNDYNNNGWGDGYGDGDFDGDFGFNMSGSSRAHGRGYGNGRNSYRGYNGYGYAPYGYGYAPYGYAPVAAPVAPVAPAAAPVAQ